MKPLQHTVIIQRNITFKEQVEQTIAYVLAWLKASDEDLQKKTDRVEAPYPIYGRIAWILFVVSAVVTLGSCGHMMPDQPGGPSLPFPFIGWIAFALLFVTCPIAIIVDRKTDKITKLRRGTKRSALQAERERDPFYQRAMLISQAKQNFDANCDRYQLKYELVTQHLEQCDDATSDDYYTKLEHAIEVIKRAVANFVTATQHAHALGEFTAKHPAIRGKPENTALAQLVELLDQPMQMPESDVKDPRDVLAYENTLQQLLLEMSPRPEDFDRRLAESSTETTRQRVAESDAAGTDGTTAEPKQMTA